MKIHFLFPDHHLFYSCNSCRVNCCRRNDKILLNNDFSHPFQNNFTLNQQMHHPGGCNFLHQSGFCTLERQRGKYQKPAICNLFPLLILQRDETLYISVDIAQCRISNSGTYPITHNSFYTLQNHYDLSHLYLQKSFFWGFDPVSFPGADDGGQLLWSLWNSYFETDLSYPKTIWWLDLLKEVTLFYSDLTDLSPEEYLALHFWLLLWENSSGLTPSTFELIQLYRSFRATIKLLASFLKKDLFNLKQTEHFFEEISTIYILNRDLPLYQALNSITIGEKGNLLNLLGLLLKDRIS